MSVISRGESVSGQQEGTERGGEGKEEVREHAVSIPGLDKCLRKNYN